ncbi:MAG TPA: hypothetical protein VNO83_06545 [Pseudonocardia sp.]|nr:hypothetical protein [Pseudonocardia sp.]
MAFVHGHPRDLGWVKAHRRRPNHAEHGQLPLIADGTLPGAELPGAEPAAGTDGGSATAERERPRRTARRLPRSGGQAG